MAKGKMETWNVSIAGKFFCTVNAYTRKSARLQAKRMPNLRSGEIYVTRAKVADVATSKTKMKEVEYSRDPRLLVTHIDWSAPDQLGTWGDTGA